MSETTEHFNEPTGPVVTTTPPPPVEPVVVERQKPNRLYQAAAWVAIVAGSIFIISVIFFAGFVLGRHSDGSGNFGRHHGELTMIERGGPPRGPMMWPGEGRQGPGNFGPGPGNFGPSSPAQPQPRP